MHFRIRSTYLTCRQGECLIVYLVAKQINHDNPKKEGKKKSSHYLILARYLIKYIGIQLI